MKKTAPGKTINVVNVHKNNLNGVSLKIPKGMLIALTGVSGSGKSSLAFGTLYAEAQRRLLDSMNPYDRVNMEQPGLASYDEISGLPPGIALKQSLSRPGARSTVGTISQLADLSRILYSRCGDYPVKASRLLASDFSPNTPSGACPVCHGVGWTYDLNESVLVPDPGKSIAQGAILGWSRGWHGNKFKHILISLGVDTERPWHKIPKHTRDWILFSTEERQVPVYPELSPAEVAQAIKNNIPPRYMGTFVSVSRYARQYLSEDRATPTKKAFGASLKCKVCLECSGKGLKRESLAVIFSGLDIAEMGDLDVKSLVERLSVELIKSKAGERTVERSAAQKVIGEMHERAAALVTLGLGHLSMSRNASTLSGGELQRVRLATLLRSELADVMYVLDEPSSGLHASDVDRLVTGLRRLVAQGNTVLVVEHNLQIIRQCDWMVDIGPGAGPAGGKVVYNGALTSIEHARDSVTVPYLIDQGRNIRHSVKRPASWMHLRNVNKHTLCNFDVDVPLNVVATICGVSGVGKSTLVSDILVESLSAVTQDSTRGVTNFSFSEKARRPRRVVVVDQKPIGRSLKSVLATYIGIFDHVRAAFAATPSAKKLNYGADRFSFNLREGRCSSCDGDGIRKITLHFMAAVSAPCDVCKGGRFNDATLEAKLNGKTIAEVLGLTVDQAVIFFDEAGLSQKVTGPLTMLSRLGLGYLPLGQSTPDMSGGEAQRIKLVSEVGLEPTDSVYILDEPCTGLHPANVDLLFAQFERLIDLGNTVVIVEHDPRAIAKSDWVIDLGLGKKGVIINSQGAPATVAASRRGISKFLTPYVVN